MGIGEKFGQYSAQMCTLQVCVSEERRGGFWGHTHPIWLMVYSIRVSGIIASPRAYINSLIMSFYHSISFYSFLFYFSFVEFFIHLQFRKKRTWKGSLANGILRKLGLIAASWTLRYEPTTHFSCVPSTEEQKMKINFYIAVRVAKIFVKLLVTRFPRRTQHWAYQVSAEWWTFFLLLLLKLTEARKMCKNRHSTTSRFTITAHRAAPKRGRFVLGQTTRRSALYIGSSTFPRYLSSPFVPAWS
jgi:hypothetical protein